ncbi:MAG TPA: ABC transporter permease subunit [Candidatus Limnocylindrales bacterium]
MSDLAAAPDGGARRAAASGRVGRALAAWGPALPLLAVLAFCLVVPVALLLARSFVTVDGIGLGAWSRVLATPLNQRAIVTSVELGLACAIVSVVVGTPLAWLVSRMLAGRRASWLGLFNVAAHFGGIGLAFAYVATLGSFGMVTLLLRGAGLEATPPDRASLAALVITYEHANIPLFVLLTVPAMGMLREEWWEAAQTAGASRLQFWRRIGLPLLLPFIGAGFVLSFTWSIGIYGIAYALAGQSAALPIQLITLQIGEALSNDAIRGPERAAVLSVVLMALAIGALLLYRALLRRGTRWLAAGRGATSGTERSARPASGGRLGRLGGKLLFGGFALYIVLPIVAVLLYSLAGRWTANVLPDYLTLAHWQRALASTRIGGAFVTSLSLAGWTTLIVLALTVPAAYWARVRNARIRPLLELSAAIPFALPFVVLGFALLHFTGTFVPPLQGTYTLVVLAYVAVSFPFVYWAIDNALAAADVRRLTEAAAVAGASTWQTIRRVVLPNIRAGIATAAMLAFALAIGEFALVKVLAGSLNTIPILSASMMLDSGGTFAPLAVVTSIVFVMLFVMSVAIAWLNRDRLTGSLAGPAR